MFSHRFPSDYYAQPTWKERLFYILSCGCYQRTKFATFFGFAVGLLCISTIVTILAINLISEKDLSTVQHHHHVPTNHIPSFFATHGIPPIFLEYRNMHNSMTSHPTKETSKFLVYRMPNQNETSISKSFLGLTSSFLLAVLTDRALIIDWNNQWEAVNAPISATPMNKIFSPVHHPRPENHTVTNVLRNLRSIHTMDESSNHSSTPIPPPPTINPVHLQDILEDPGFYWRLDSLLVNYPDAMTDLSSSPEIRVSDEMDLLVCHDIERKYSSFKFITIDSVEYFLPYLLMNRLHSMILETSLNDPTMIFEQAFNFLVRPVPSVLAAVDRFKKSYFDGYYVIGMNVQTRLPFTLSESIDDHYSDDDDDDKTEEAYVSVDDDEALSSIMSEAVRLRFFSAAQEIASHMLDGRQPSTMQRRRLDEYYRKGKSRGDGGDEIYDDDRPKVALFVVTDDEPLLRTQLQSLSVEDQQKLLSLTSVLAISMASGDGTDFVRQELQNTWLLGMCDVVVTTPGSPLGIIGHARMGISPYIVMDEEYYHKSSVSHPCMASQGTVQHSSCFVPSMLSKYPYDPAVPC